MARNFAGGGAKISCSAGASGITAPVTAIAIATRDQDAAGMDWWSSGTANWSVTINSSNKLVYSGPSTVAAPNAGLTVANGWALIGISKTSGTTAPRFHSYLYSTNAWIHENGASNSADPSAPSGVSNIGGWSGSYKGTVALLGLWNVVLSDAQVESLPFSLAAWFQVNPQALWLLDQQATGQKVLDLTGNGANESALTGTTVGTSSVPVFSYGLPDTWVSRQPAAGAGGAAGPRDLLLLRAG